MAKRILVVEDDAALAEVLRDNLVIDGFEVEIAADSDQALSKHRTFMPDLILLDIMLPGRSGFDIGNVLSQNRKTRRRCSPKRSRGFAGNWPRASFRWM